jgi:hypothetical protein
MEPHDTELEDQLREALHTAAAPVHGEGVRADVVRQAVAQRRRNRRRVRTALVTLAPAAAVAVVAILMAMPDSGERVDTTGRPDRTTTTDVTTAPSGDEEREPPGTSSSTTTTEPDATATSSTPAPDPDAAATSPTTGGQPTRPPPTLTANLSPTVVAPNGRLVYSSVDPCPVVEGVRLHVSYWNEGVLDSGQEDALPLHDEYVEVHESGAWSTVFPAPAAVGRYEVIASCLTDDQDPSDPLPGDPAVIHAEYRAIDFEVVPAS